MVVGILPGVVTSFREMMKKESLVNVSWLVSVAGGGGSRRSLFGSGQCPVGDRHAVIGESRGSDVDTVGMNGGCGIGRFVLVLLIVLLLLLWVGIIGVINGRSGPMGRWGWVLWVPVALDLFMLVVVGSVDRVQNAVEALGF